MIFGALMKLLTATAIFLGYDSKRFRCRNLILHFSLTKTPEASESQLILAIDGTYYLLLAKLSFNPATPDNLPYPTIAL